MGLHSQCCCDGSLCHNHLAVSTVGPELPTYVSCPCSPPPPPMPPALLRAPSLRPLSARSIRGHSVSVSLRGPAMGHGHTVQCHLSLSVHWPNDWCPSSSRSSSTSEAPGSAAAVAVCCCCAMCAAAAAAAEVEGGGCHSSRGTVLSALHQELQGLGVSPCGLACVSPYECASLALWARSSGASLSACACGSRL